jgi:hypothetical protein
MISPYFPCFFQVFVAFSHMFHGFLRKKHASLHGGGVQQAPAERATTGGATKALRKAGSAEPWRNHGGGRGFPHDAYGND